MKNHITRGNVFDDLGFPKYDVTNLKIRSLFMIIIGKEIIKRNLTQEEAAQLLGVTQSRISDLKRGKIQLFSLDTLINMLVKLDKEVSFTVENREVGDPLPHKPISHNCNPATPRN